MSDLDDRTVRLLEAVAMLTAAQQNLELVIEQERLPYSEDERAIIAASIMMARAVDPRTRADAMCWIRAMMAGDEAWLVCHTSPGGKVDAIYHGRLSREQRAMLGR